MAAGDADGHLPVNHEADSAEHLFSCRWAPIGIMRGPALPMFRHRACLYLAGCFSPAFYFEGRLREMPCRLSEAGHCYAILHTHCYIGSAFVPLP